MCCARSSDDEESAGGRPRTAGDVMHKVLLTTPRFFAFEAMIRGHLAEHGCEVLEHRAHDMQMKEETLLTLVPEAAGMITALEPVTARVLAAAPRDLRHGRGLRPHRRGGGDRSRGDCVYLGGEQSPVGGGADAGPHGGG